MIFSLPLFLNWKFGLWLVAEKPIIDFDYLLDVAYFGLFWSLVIANGCYFSKWEVLDEKKC